MAKVSEKAELNVSFMVELNQKEVQVLRDLNSKIESGEVSAEGLVGKDLEKHLVDLLSDVEKMAAPVIKKMHDAVDVFNGKKNATVKRKNN